MGVYQASPLNAQIALDLAQKGRAVFPCFERDEGECRAKAPCIKGGFHSASADPVQVNKWWSRRPGAAVGIALEPGEIVLDTDMKTDPDTGEVMSGDDTLQFAGYLDHANAATVQIRTPGGGIHRLFKVPNPEKFSNGSSVNGLSLVDLRVCGKGYIIAPGSVVAAGVYQPLKGRLGDSLVSMPEPLAKALRKPKPSLSQRAAAVALTGGNPGGAWVLDHGEHRLSEYGRQRLEKRLRAHFDAVIAGVHKAGPGTRHKAALNASRTLAGYAVSYQAYTFAAVAEAVLNASIENGHTEKDGLAVTVAAIRAGIEDGARLPLLLDDRRAAR